jgi:hypothetical protein
MLPLTSGHRPVRVQILVELVVRAKYASAAPELVPATTLSARNAPQLVKRDDAGVNPARSDCVLHDVGHK